MSVYKLLSMEVLYAQMTLCVPIHLVPMSVSVHQDIALTWEPANVWIEYNKGA